LVDDTGVIQIVEDFNTSWHCGDNQGSGRYLNGCTNSNSIGIELCINRDGDYNKAFNNLVTLTKELMAKYKIPPYKVVRHFDVSRKRCPSSMTGNNWELWKKFKGFINDTKTPYTPTPPTTPKKPIPGNTAMNPYSKMAMEVINGNYGNGESRKNNIYSTIQREVNRIAYGRQLRNDHITDIAKEVISGKFGNGNERKNLLYRKIQSEVNRILG